MIRHQILALKNTLLKPVSLYSTSITAKEDPQALFEKLTKEFTAAKPILLKLRKYDGLNGDFSEWKSHIKVMMTHNFSDIECFKMISRYPSLLDITMSKFEGTIQQWFHADMESQDVKSILLNHPVLFEVGKDDIRSRLPKLRVKFGSAKALAKLLTSSPNVMYDNWSTVVMRIDYLLENRRFKGGEITQSPTLTKSLDFMKFRFDLLEKCGVYKQSKVPIHKENKYDKSGHINPSLTSILMTSTKEFVKIAKITQEEYQVFSDLYMADETDGSDSDTEDQKFKKCF